MTSNHVSKDVKSEFERVDRTLMLEFGEYWRFTPAQGKDASQVASAAFEEGEIYPICDLLVNLITDEIQTVELYANKLNGRAGKTRVSYEKFSLNFTPVPQDEAEAIRRAQLKQLEDESKQIQADIQLALTNQNALLRMIHESDDKEIATQKESLHVSLGLPSPEAMASRNTGIIPEAGSMLAVDEQKKRFENQVSLGQMANRIAKVKADALSNNLTIASSIMMEKAVVIQGKAGDMLRKVDNVIAKVNIMKLYLGEEVEVQTIIDGELSTSINPFELYSSMVYMDEEISINRIYSDSEAFDFSRQKDFIEYLRSTPSLIKRIFPSERSIITIRPTRDDRAYSTNYEWVTNNIHNRIAFLMVRDGERISAIYSPVNYNERLFPISSEMDAFFDGIFARSTDLVDKQRSFKKLGDTYHGLVAVLQGVKDRQVTGGTEVFGELVADVQGKSFLNETCLKRNCVFIDEEDNLIGDDKESPVAWMNNALNTPLFSKGDIVVYSPHRYLGENTIPSAYKEDRDGDAQTDWSIPTKIVDGNTRLISDKLAYGRITLFKGEPVLMIELEHWRGERKTFRSYPTRTNRALNLMSVPPSFIESALQSRRYRSELFKSGFMDFIVEAREIIKGIQAQTAALNASLKAYYPNFTDDEIHLMIMGWYRTYDGTSKISVKTATTKIVNDYQKAAAFNPTTIETATTSLKALGDVPLFASKLNGELYIIAHSRRLLGRYSLIFSGMEYPFFALHRISPSGEVISTELVGSEMQTYPVSQILHYETPYTAFDEKKDQKPTLSINHFGITDQRYSGAEFIKLNKTAADNRKFITDTLTAIEGCITESHDETRDMLAMKLICKLALQLTKIEPHVKGEKGNVSFGIIIAPYTIKKAYRVSTMLYNGIGINIPRAIKYLFTKMSPFGRQRYTHDINEMLEDALLWDRALKKLTTGEEGLNEFIGTFEDGFTAQMVGSMVYSQTRALEAMRTINNTLSARQRSTTSKQSDLLTPFVELIRSEANAPTLFKEAGL